MKTAGPGGILKKLSAISSWVIACLCSGCVCGVDVYPCRQTCDGSLAPVLSSDSEHQQASKSSKTLIADQEDITSVLNYLAVSIKTPEGSICIVC